MFIDFVLIFTFSLFIEIFLQNIWIKKMRKLKIEQVTKLYGPSWHEKTKTGTPTMGGVVFLPVLGLSFCAAGFFSKEVQLVPAAQVVSYPMLAAAVGLFDDWLKYRKHSSD